MESDSLISMMSTDSISLDQNDTTEISREIETTINYPGIIPCTDISRNNHICWDIYDYVQKFD